MRERYCIFIALGGVAQGFRSAKPIATPEAVFGIEGGVVVIIRRRSSGVRALHS